MKIIRHADKAKAPTRPADRTLPWMQFPEEPRPSFADTLTFPPDITALTPREVSALHGRYTAMFAYATAEQAKLRIEKLRYESEAQIHKNNIQRNGVTYGRRKGDVDTQVRLDMKMQQLYAAMISLDQRILFIDSRISIFDRYMNTLSRELTRRTSEFQKTR